MYKRIALSVMILGVASAASAGRVWVNDVAVNQVGEFGRVSSGTTYKVLYVRSDDLKTANLGCAPTDEHGVVSTMTTSSFNSNNQLRYSTLLSAHAQNKTVDLLLDMSDCNTSSTWTKHGAPYGRGLKLVGVVINE